MGLHIRAEKSSDQSATGTHDHRLSHKAGTGFYTNGTPQVLNIDNPNDRASTVSNLLKYYFT